MALPVQDSESEPHFQNYHFPQTALRPSEGEVHATSNYDRQLLHDDGDDIYFGLLPAHPCLLFYRDRAHPIVAVDSRKLDRKARPI